MKYNVVFTGLVVLTSVTQAAYMPRFSKSEITKAFSTAAGPEFPVTLPKNKEKRGGRRYRRHRPHCAAAGQWKCYREHVKTAIRNGAVYDSDEAKEFCKTTGEHRPHCNASDQSEVDPKDMADILAEIEVDKAEEKEKEEAEQRKAQKKAAQQAAKEKEEAENEAAEKERERLEASKPNAAPFVDPLRDPDDSELLPQRR